MLLTVQCMYLDSAKICILLYTEEPKIQSYSRVVYPYGFTWILLLPPGQC